MKKKNVFQNLGTTEAHILQGAKYTQDIPFSFRYEVWNGKGEADMVVFRKQLVWFSEDA